MSELPKYDDYSETVGMDFIIPAKSGNIQKKVCKILELENRTNAAGKTYPVMTLEERDTGTKFIIPAWIRDVASLCKEWSTNAAEWLNKDVEFSVTDKRMSLIPTTITKEEVVSSSSS